MSEHSNSVEVDIRRLAIGAGVIFFATLLAFAWVERQTAANLKISAEVVDPARETATMVDRSLGALLMQQSKIAGSTSKDEVTSIQGRDEAVKMLARASAKLSGVAEALAHSDSGISDGFDEEFDAAFEGLLEADEAFRAAHIERHELSEKLEREIAAVEKDLKKFLEAANGISGKMRFEYGSRMRKLRRRLSSEGWTASVQGSVKSEVLSSSSRLNMIVGDVLSLASELNRLSGKVGLVSNADQLRSLRLNELVPTRDRLRVALDDLVFEMQDRDEIANTARGLETVRMALSQRIMSLEDTDSLVSLKGALLAAERESAELQDQLAGLASKAKDLTGTLMGAAEHEQASFADSLASAGAVARVLLMALLAAAVIGGVIGLKSVRRSLGALRKTNEDLSRLKDELTVLNEGLEAKVAERTAALDARNQSMRLVLDNVEQGLVTIDAAGCLEGEYSAQFGRWFGAVREGTSFSDCLEAEDKRAATMFELGWSQVELGFLPLAVNLGQLPKQIVVRGRRVQVDYRPVSVEGDVPQSTLLVMTDVEEHLEREKAEATEREFAQVFRHIMRHRASFVEFFQDAERLVERMLGGADANPDFDDMFRAIHTLKGNCSLFGLERIAAACHEVESAMVEEQRVLEPERYKLVAEVWEETADRIRQLLPSTDDTVSVDLDDLENIIEVAREHDTSSDVIRRLESWKDEPVRGRLHRLKEQASALAKRLDKPELIVSIDGGEVRMPKDVMAPFWGSLTHVIRNSLDHGLESAAERAVAGKPENGRVEFLVKEQEDGYIITVSDDGRGIDWKKLATKAESKGLSTATQDDLVKALFADGISSKDEVSSISGRGVGMSAVAAACRRLGGKIEVFSAEGEGTSFAFFIPRAVLERRRVQLRTGATTGTLDLSQSVIRAANEVSPPS